MKSTRTLAALVAPVLTLTALCAKADAYDCFPLCPEAAQTAAVQAPLNLCDHAAVREVAKLDNDLAPVKRIYSIAMNPTGFALEQVSEHVVHIPPWVGYVANPQGAIRAKVMDTVRKQVKKQVGLQDSCATQIAEEGGTETTASDTQVAEAP
jgi:hypothetical protein